MKLRKICIIANYFPTENDPIYSFLQEVVFGFAEKNIECHVITPMSIGEKKHRAFSRVMHDKNGKKIFVHCPIFFSIPARLLGRRLATKINGNNYNRAAYAAFKKYVKNCDVIYSHFLNMGGIAAGYISNKADIPGVVACGESDFSPERIGYGLFDNELAQLRGVISVSTEIKNELQETKQFKDKSIMVLPNGVDLKKFYQIDRKLARDELGIEYDKYIIAFVGHFIERKGIDKVIDVINNNEDIYGIFIGDNKLPYKCDRALIVSKVSHDRLSIYLNAADVFVLPTLREGCCNSIIEAQACGLPIVSSDKAFNYDIISEETGILIDPTNLTEIEDAVVLLKTDHELRAKLSEKSLEMASKRDIEERVSMILEYLEKVINA